MTRKGRGSTYQKSLPWEQAADKWVRRDWWEAESRGLREDAPVLQ